MSEAKKKLLRRKDFDDFSGKMRYSLFKKIRDRIMTRTPTSEYLTDRRTSARMRMVTSSGTLPERIVRKTLSRLGCRRYGSNSARLPGHPDVVIGSRHKVIFVHGCFWHRHAGCPRSSIPARNVKLWRLKFQNTIRRDRTSIKALKRLGWGVLVVWECETHKDSTLIYKIKKFLDANKR